MARIIRSMRWDPHILRYLNMLSERKHKSFTEIVEAIVKEYMKAYPDG